MGLVVVGAAGYIGHRIAAVAPDALRVFHAGAAQYPADAAVVSLEAPAGFDYARIGAGDVVLMTAGISSPDRCAKDPEHTRAVNVTGTGEFIARLLDRGASVIFFSTDAVYGEQPEPFDETQPCRPLGVYAEFKHEVEQRFLGTPGFKTIRLSLVFSRDDSFTTYLTRTAAVDAEASLYSPFQRAVIHRDDVVLGALSLARNLGSFPGNVVNFGGPAVLDRPEIASVLGAAVLPGLRWTTATPPPDFFANRARSICMTSPILAGLLARPPATLQQAVALEFHDLSAPSPQPSREMQ
jgi:nucleoside-diphosphate-sugar epimerase